jgi:hypothetical protein
MELARDILDQQILDRDGQRLGRIDGIVAELREGAPPRVLQLEVGFVPLARRISLGFERFADAMHKRLDVRRSARYGIPWSAVIDVKMHFIKVDLDAEKSVAYDWERWLRRHVVKHLGGGDGEESSDE